MSTQAIVILGCILIDHMPWDKEIAFFAFTALFLLGFMLYLFVITMIFYRFAFKELEPAQLSPTYWINAGPWRLRRWRARNCCRIRAHRRC